MNLILQGRDVQTRDLKDIARLAGASGIDALGPDVFRLNDAQPHADLEARCNVAQLDCAFVPAERQLADFRLLVMDMDSTLITIETIDELADMLGLKPEVAAITEAAMRGEIEYNESLQRRAGLLKGLSAAALDRVYEERLRLSPGAERMLQVMQRAGLRTLLVSGGFTAITERLKSRLHLDSTHANTLEVENGVLTGNIVGRIVNAEGKRDELLRVRDALGIRNEQIIGVGDGANDLKFLAECGVSVAYRAKPIVRGQTTHAINHVGLDGLLAFFNAG